jgi:transposase InsO family protein
LQWLWNHQKGRLARWALRTSEFDFTIIHRKGKENVVPDHASRYPQEEYNVGCETEEGRLENALVCIIARGNDQLLAGVDVSPFRDRINNTQLEQPTDILAWNMHAWRQQLLTAYQDPNVDSECKVCSIYNLLTTTDNGSDNTKVKGVAKGYTMDAGKLLRRNIEVPVGPEKTLVKQNQLVIPTSMRKQILNMFHEHPLSGHLGRNKMYFKMLPLVWWPGMYRDIRIHVACCVPCQRHKSATVKNRPLFSSIPNSIWDVACIDLVGPLPISEKGNKYICVITDLFSKWAEAIPIPDKTACSVAEAVFTGLFCRHSVPNKIRTDQGTEFTNVLMQTLLERMGIKHKQTCPYYPQANGHVERFNRTLIESLKKQCEYEPVKWEKFLEGSLFAYRTSVHESLSVSPFEVVYGRKPTLPVSLLEPTDAQVESDVVQHGTRITYNLAKMHKVIKSLLKDTAQIRNDKWNATAKPLTLKVNDWVLLKDRRIKTRKLIESSGNLLRDAEVEQQLERLGSAKFQSEWLGPYKVLKVKTNAIEIDDTDRNEVRTVSLAHLKFFHAEAVGEAVTDKESQQLGTKEDSENINKNEILPPAAPTAEPPAVGMARDEPVRRSHRQPKRKHFDPSVWDCSENDAHKEKICNSEENDCLTLYNIEKILAHEKSSKQFFYFIQWEGYDASHNSWIRADNMVEKDLLISYWKVMSEKVTLNEMPASFRHLHPDASRSQTKWGKRRYH